MRKAKRRRLSPDLRDRNDAGTQSDSFGWKSSVGTLPELKPRPGPVPWRSALGRSFFLLPAALDYLGSTTASDGSSDILFSSAAEHEDYLAILQETFDAFQPWRPVGGFRGEGARWEGESWAEVDRYLEREDKRCEDRTKRPAASSPTPDLAIEGEVGGWVIDSLGDRPPEADNDRSPASSPDPEAAPRTTWRAAVARSKPKITYDALPLAAGAVGDDPGPLAVTPARKKSKRARLKALLPTRCALTTSCIKNANRADLFCSYPAPIPLLAQGVLQLRRARPHQGLVPAADLAWPDLCRPASA